MTYSVNYRRKVLSVREKEGLTISEVATRFNVCTSSVNRWLKSLEPKNKRNKAATKIDMEKLKQDVIDYPDSYNYERAKRLSVGVTTIFDALRRLGVSYKKNTETPEGRCRRTAYFPKEN